MSPHKLLIHPDVFAGAQRHNLIKKLDWTLVQLAVNGGRTLIVKGTVGQGLKWRRTPLQGSHYYLWWLPKNNHSGQAIYARDIRLHDKNSEYLGLDGNKRYLDFGSEKQYEEWPVDKIDPREDEQKQVSQELVTANGSDVTVCTVQGAPGCGKTIAIQYTTQDLFHKRGSHKILYVTYNRGLAEKAVELFNAYGLRQDSVIVLTLQQLKNKLLNKAGSEYSPKQAKSAFEAFVSQDIHRPRLGNWSGYLDLLWTEIRAYILGMALPLKWHRDGLEKSIPHSEDTILDEQSYYDLRRQTFRNAPVLHQEDMERAYQLAKIAKDENFFQDQLAAYQALNSVKRSNLARHDWIKNLDAIVIDEVQDFTLLEIALLAVVGKLALFERDQNLPFSLVAAGDESQTLQPSGFDWGITKNFFGQILSTSNHPANVEMRRQRRSPKKLAELILKSRKLYRTLEVPAEIRPQAGLRMELGGDAYASDETLLLRCRVEAEHWSKFFEEITGKYPGSALIDLDNSLRQILKQLPDAKISEAASGLLYDPSHIKGLDRNLIFLAGLDTVIQGISNRQNGRGTQTHTSNLFALQTRQAVDMIRVAISRSTHSLIVLEQHTNVDYLCLGLHKIDQVDIDELFSRLAGGQSTQEDKIELIHAHWKNAEEHITGGRLLEAKNSAWQAEQLITGIGDQALLAQQEKLEAKISRVEEKQKIEHLLEESEEFLEQLDFDRARTKNQDAQNLLTALKAGPDLSPLTNETKAQREKIKREENKAAVRESLQSAEKFIRNNEVVKASRELTKAAKLLDKLDNGTDIPPLRQKYQNLHTSIAQQNKKLDQEASRLWKEANQQIKAEIWGEAAASFKRAADIRRSQGNPSYEALQCLADRYRKVPQTLFDIPFALEKDLDILMNLTEKYIDILRKTETGQVDAARKFAVFWLDEICKICSENRPGNIDDIRERFLKAVHQVKEWGGKSQNGCWK